MAQHQAWAARTPDLTLPHHIPRSPTILAHFPDAPHIVAPGTLDAGDVCEAGTHVFIGISQRTTHEMLRALGYPLEILDMSEYAKMDGGLSCLSLRF